MELCQDTPLLSVQDIPYFVKITKQLLGQNCVCIQSQLWRFSAKNNWQPAIWLALWKWTGFLFQDQAPVMWISVICISVFIVGEVSLVPQFWKVRQNTNIWKNMGNKNYLQLLRYESTANISWYYYINK